MRLKGHWAVAGLMVVGLGCASMQTSFGPYPSILGPAGAGVASFITDNGTDIDTIDVECGSVGQNQIGIVVFNLDDVTNEYAGNGMVGTGPVNHDVVVMFSDRTNPPRQVASFTVPGCGAQCQVVSCTSTGLFYVQDALYSSTASGGTDYTHAAFQINPDVAAMSCGKTVPVFIYRQPAGNGGWRIVYDFQSLSPMQGCPTGSIVQFLAQIGFQGNY